MFTLYDNPFSPFARKVRMVLAWKGVSFESIDALALDEQARLHGVNPRGEVPVLAHGDLTIVGSADIAAYLEDLIPEPALMPATPALRAKARAWQRVADTDLDAVIHDVSLWTWPTHHRSDQPPAGLIEAGWRDVEALLGRLDAAIGSARFVCGEPSIADLALFPHVSSLKVLGMSLATFPSVVAWNAAMRELDVVRADLAYVKQSATEKFAGATSPYEGVRVVWRGDRIEWLLAHGHRDWLFAELAAGRAVVPRAI